MSVQLSMPSIIDTLGKVIADEWPGQVPADGIGPETEIFYAGIGLDSIDGVTLIILLEETFAIDIDSDALSMDVFENVRSLGAFIAARLCAHA